MEKIKEYLFNVVSVISLIAGALLFIFISAVDSESNIPIIICGACIGWFVLLYIGAWIADHIEIVVE